MQTLSFGPRTLRPPRDQRDNITASSMDFDLIPAKEDFLHPIIQADVERRKSNIAEQGNVAKRLIEPSTERSDDDDFFWFKFDGTLDGKFKIGFIFIVWK